MGRHAFTQTPDYISHLKRRDLVGPRIVNGVTQQWNMPVAIFDVHGGFDNRADPDAIDHHTLKWRVSGSPVHAITSADRKSSPNTAVCVQARESRARYWSSGDLVCAHIYIPVPLLRHLATEIHEERGDGTELLRADVPFAEDARLAAAAHKYLGVALRQDTPCALEMDTRSLVLGTHLLLRYSILAPKKPRKLTGRLTPAQLSRALDLLATPSARPIRLAEVAQQAALSQFHFCRGFYATVGVPPHRWMIEVRLERAKKLLKVGKLSVAEVSASVGFPDSSYFARLFKKRTGVAPAEYRKHA